MTYLFLYTVEHDLILLFLSRENVLLMVIWAFYFLSGILKMILHGLNLKRRLNNFMEMQDQMKFEYSSGGAELGSLWGL